MWSLFYYSFLRFSTSNLHRKEEEKKKTKNTVMIKLAVLLIGQLVIRRSFSRNKQQHIELPLWTNTSCNAYAYSQAPRENLVSISP